MLLVINSILVGVVIAFLTIYLLDRKTQKEQVNILLQKDLETQKTFKQIFGNINRFIKITSKLNECYKTMKDGVGNTIKLIDQDITNLVNIQKSLISEVKEIAQRHNELSEETFAGFQRVYCEMFEGDCSECSMYPDCKGECPPDTLGEYLGEEYSVEPKPEDISTTGDTGLGTIMPKGEMQVDPRDSKSIASLKEAMASTGVPLPVIEQYIASIFSIPVPPSGKILARWEAGRIISNKSQPKKEKETTERMINPKSKIVKTLNKLLDQN